MELFYLGTALSTLWTVDNSTKRNTGTGTNLTTSVVSWTGAAGFTLAKLSVTVTINMIGQYQIRVHLGKYEAAKQLNVCPKVEVT